MNENLFDSYLDSMNFLNEACILYPDAISFGSGRPKERFFNVRQSISGIFDYAGSDKRLDDLGQYNLTKGIINAQVAKLLENDEQIYVKPEHIVITDGAQEGMLILINALCQTERDVLLVSEPSYVGFIGYAKIRGIELCCIKRNDEGIDLDDLSVKVKGLRNNNKNPIALYEVIDFHNPTGSSLPVASRRRLIELARELDFYVIEDNPYGYFSFEGEKKKPLKAFDLYKRVIYLGSFSKSIFPGLRLGYIIVDQEMKKNGNIYPFSAECKKVKSFTTVNSSTVLQAMLGAILDKENYTLTNYCKAKVADCKKNSELIHSELNKYGLYTNRTKPSGGFFTTVSLPFDLNDHLVIDAAKNFGVIICPMNMFCIDQTMMRNEIRLSYSYMEESQIIEGISRLNAFITSHSCDNLT